MTDGMDDGDLVGAIHGFSLRFGDGHIVRKEHEGEEIIPGWFSGHDA
jgi:hypothetical protein